MSTPPPGRVSDLPDFVDRHRTSHGPHAPGVAAAVVSLDGDLAATTGCADIAAGLPVTEDTVFRIASISKPILAIALLRLEKRGILSRSDELRKHLPNMPDYGTPILLDHLLHHRSGLHEKLELLSLGGADHADHMDLSTVMALFARQRSLNFDVDRGYLYCNTGFTLLSDIMERVTERPFEEILRREVFDPLGMPQSQVARSDDMIVRGMARGYVGPPDGRTHGHYGFPVRGEGGVVSTLAELITFVRALLRDGVPDVRVSDLAAGNSGDGLWYGAGFVCRRLNGVLMMGHSGHLPGFKSEIAVLPDEGIGTVWLTNDDRADSFGANLALVRKALGLEGPHRDPIPPPLRGRWIDKSDGAILDIAEDGCSAALFGDPFPLFSRGPGRWVAEADVIDLALESVAGDLRLRQGGRELGPLSRAAGEEATKGQDAICGCFHCPETETTLSIQHADAGFFVDTAGPHRHRRVEPATHLGEGRLLWIPHRRPWPVWYTIRPAGSTGDVSEILISSARMRNLRAFRVD